MVESGLGGKLVRGAPFGGRGNCPILVVFRRLFPGVGSPEGAGEASDVLRVGTKGVDCACIGLGSVYPCEVTDRAGNFEVGVGREDGPVEDVGLESGASGISGRALRVFGKAGRGPDGGAAAGGLEGRYAVVVMVADI